MLRAYLHIHTWCGEFTDSSARLRFFRVFFACFLWFFRCAVIRHCFSRQFSDSVFWWEVQSDVGSDVWLQCFGAAPPRQPARAARRSRRRRPGPGPASLAALPAPLQPNDDAPCPPRSNSARSIVTDHWAACDVAGVTSITRPPSSAGQARRSWAPTVRAPRLSRRAPKPGASSARRVRRVRPAGEDVAGDGAALCRSTEVV